MCDLCCAVLVLFAESARYTIGSYHSVRRPPVTVFIYALTKYTHKMHTSTELHTVFVRYAGFTVQVQII